MKKLSTFLIAGTLGAMTGCAFVSDGDKSVPLASQRPITLGAPSAAEAQQRPAMEWSEKSTYQASGPSAVNMLDVPMGVYVVNNKLDTGWGQDGPRRIPSPISAEEADKLRAAAQNLPVSERIQQMNNVTKNGPTAGVSFDSLDYNDCCGGGGNVPPDPELAVGPDHIIAVVNVAIEIYDKSGNLLVGPVTLSSFFSGTPGCSSSSTFDPNVLYDESTDRFIIAADGNGTDYCVAASQTGDPLGSWWGYGFATNIGGAFFDYPHAGVGVDAIFMGSNQFGGTAGFEGRVFAMDKAAMYSGAAMAVSTHSTGDNSTPQPMNSHGVSDGSFPTSGPHYIMTEVFDGNNHSVWSWSDPFGTNIFTNTGTLDLSASTGVAAGFPVDVPQAGSSAKLQANDYRGLDTEYRNGSIWMTNTISCNPGTGTVDCLRWAQIDPTGPTVLDSGVIASNDEYRTFPDLAVNQCDDMAIGYTKSSTAMFPSVYVTGRESGDPAGTTQAEVEMKAGEITYTAFDGSPHRWGDYTGMTIDPDGKTFWYLGEYSKDTGQTNGRWGNYIGSFSYPDCGGVVMPDDITGTSTGLTGRVLICKNLSSGQTIRANNVAAVNCSDLGFMAAMGDDVSIQMTGRAEDTLGDFGGSTTGMDNATVVCRNNSIGQRVRVANTTPDWSCNALGLTVSDNDRVTSVVTGVAQ
ncbi:MAG: hypothetical protein ACI88A_000446 [Paraglaciecola sp.]|jgi:hypothetical protein